MKLKNINIKERMKYYHVPGLSMTFIEHGQISNTENYGLLEMGSNKNVNNDTIFSACSISKFLTGILVMKLTEQGILDLDEDINNRLESWKVPDTELTKNKRVTLRSLLSHQSGIIDPKGSFSELHSTFGIPSMVELLEGKTPYCKEPIEVKYEPGSEFHYSDTNFCIIQQLIEDVTEKPFKQVVNEQIFKPLNMNKSTFDMDISETKRGAFSCGHNKNGELVKEKYPIYPYPAAAGLWTTSIELAQLVLELMNSLKGKSRIEISARNVKEMISPQGGKEWAGLGVFLNQTETGLEISSLGWGVGFQCMLMAFPYLETGAVIMTNAELGVHQMDGIIGEIYHSLL